MPWIRMRGVKGLVFSPRADARVRRKHNCPDCFYCQMCSDTRCRECRKEQHCSCRPRRRRKHAG